MNPRSYRRLRRFWWFMVGWCLFWLAWLIFFTLSDPARWPLVRALNMAVDAALLYWAGRQLTRLEHSQRHNPWHGRFVPGDYED